MLPNVTAGADYQDYFADSTAFSSRLSNFVVIATSLCCYLLYQNKHFEEKQSIGQAKENFINTG